MSHQWSREGGLYSDRIEPRKDQGSDSGPSRPPRERRRSPIRDTNRTSGPSRERSWRNRSKSPKQSLSHKNIKKERNRSRSRSRSPPRWSSRWSSRRSSSSSSGAGDREGEYRDEHYINFDDEEEGEVPRTRVEFNCEVCGVKATSFDALQTHFAGAKHQKNLRKIGYGKNFKTAHEIKDPELSGKILRCTLCSVVLTAAEVSIHISCDTHTNALEKVEGRFKEMNPDNWFEEATPKSVAPKGGFSCGVCHVTLPTFDGFQMHVKGKRHQKALKVSLQDESVFLADNVQPFWCQICNIYCTNQESLDDHLQGKRHFKTLKNKGIEDIVKTEGLNIQRGSSTNPSILPNPYIEKEIIVEPPKVCCTLCDITLSNNTEIHRHLSTTEHYLALRKAPDKQLKDILVAVEPSAKTFRYR